MDLFCSRWTWIGVGGMISTQFALFDYYIFTYIVNTRKALRLRFFSWEIIDIITRHSWTNFQYLWNLSIFWQSKLVFLGGVLNFRRRFLHFLFLLWSFFFFNKIDSINKAIIHMWNAEISTKVQESMPRCNLLWGCNGGNLGVSQTVRRMSL